MVQAGSPCAHRYTTPRATPDTRPGRYWGSKTPRVGYGASPRHKSDKLAPSRVDLETGPGIYQSRPRHLFDKFKRGGKENQLINYGKRTRRKSHYGRTNDQKWDRGKRRNRKWKKKKRFVIKKGECWQKRAVNRARIDATTWRL